MHSSIKYTLAKVIKYFDWHTTYSFLKNVCPLLCLVFSSYDLTNSKSVKVSQLKLFDVQQSILLDYLDVSII